VVTVPGRSGPAATEWDDPDDDQDDDQDDA
jgi:hypothetical protein